MAYVKTRNSSLPSGKSQLFRLHHDFASHINIINVIFTPGFYLTYKHQSHINISHRPKIHITDINKVYFHQEQMANEITGEWCLEGNNKRYKEQNNTAGRSKFSASKFLFQMDIIACKVIPQYYIHINDKRYKKHKNIDRQSKFSATNLHYSTEPPSLIML